MEDLQYSIKQVDNTNIESEHICCAIGHDKENRERAAIKKAWLSERFAEGHVFKKIDVRGKVFIEYSPGETAWAPVNAAGYQFIHCFWVSGSYKGKGLAKKLLDECERDSTGMNGIAVVSTHKKMPFFTDKSFFERHGFRVCDTAPPYFELLVKKYQEDAMNPTFKDSAKNDTIEREGIVIYYSNACPFMQPYVLELREVGEELKIPLEIIQITTTKQAQGMISASALFTAFYRGRFLTHVLLTKDKFREMILKVDKESK